MSAVDDILKYFSEVTGVDEARSRFFLESADWHLDVALSSFYENGGNVEEPSANDNAQSNRGNVAAPAPVQILSDSDMESPPGSPSAQKKDKKTKNATNQKFATLASLQQESSSDEEEGQAFYAGGSERSGQQIIGPGKGRRDIVTDMFRSVRERGGVTLEDAPPQSRGGGAFSGAGYRLGQTNDDHELVTTDQAASEGVRSVRLRLYRDGFTVDDGPLRLYSEPDNARFLNCIRQGEVPPELASGTEVRVSLEDRQSEGAPQQQLAHKAFTGKGHMLGSPTPPVVGAPPSVAAAPADQAANLRNAQQAIKVDDNKPTTTIQFRLADGTRLTGRFNHTHTIADIRTYITLAAPQYQLQNFILLTTFPSTELSDPNVTIKEANLLNSVVMQRVC